MKSAGSLSSGDFDDQRMDLRRDATLVGLVFVAIAPDKQHNVPSRKTERIVNVIWKLRVSQAPVYFLAPSINSMKRVRAA